MVDDYMLEEYNNPSKMPYPGEIIDREHPEMDKSGGEWISDPEE